MHNLRTSHFISSIFCYIRYLQESGATLATRALGYGTLYAFAGCGVLFYTGSHTASFISIIPEFKFLG
jgi:Protein of unknown function (DUF1358)